MIPNNITKENIIKALEEIDRFGIPKNRDSTKYNLKYKGRNYPPKYVISIANKYANKTELEASEFSGGSETNGFLINLGLKVYDEFGNKIINRRHREDINKEIVEDLNDTEIENVDSEKKIRKDELLKEEKNGIRVATVINTTEYDISYDEELYYDLVKILGEESDIILFPAGYFQYNEYNYSKETEDFIVEEVMKVLKEINSETVVVIGIDSDHKNNQFAIAIDHTGIIAKARKFHPTEGEKGAILKAEDYMSKEDGYSRVFKIKEKNFYIAVCNDIYGISQMQLKNPRVDSILNLIHGFYPRGEGKSGDVDFARKGLVGASKQWACPVFAAGTYFRRDISKNWPSGVLWNNKSISVKRWKYSDNPVSEIKRKKYVGKFSNAEVRIFEL